MIARSHDSKRPAQLFRHQPGAVQARFYHSTFDYIELDLRMGGDTTWVQEWNIDVGRPVGSERRVAAPSIEHTVYLSSVWCAFPAFIRFLEAITIGVEECAFSWEPEGPFGRMRWSDSGRCEGRFQLEWSARTERIDQSTWVRSDEVVRVLYQAFRSFVESSEYEPFRYERIKEWDAFSLVLADATAGDFARALSKLPREQACAAMARAAAVARARGDNSDGNPVIRQSLEWYLRANPDTDTWYMPLPEMWETWNESRRRQHLGKIWGGNGASSWHGSNLRRLRSARIEEWLAGRSLKLGERRSHVP